MNIEKLKRDRAAAVKRMREITSGAEAREDRRMTEAEGEEFQKLRSEVDSLTEQIEREEDLQKLERSLDNGKQEPPVAKRVQKQEPEERKVTQDDKEFRFGQFLQAVANMSMGRSDLVSEEIRAATGLSEGVQSDGGFLVQQDMASELFKAAISFGTLSSRVRRIPISGNSNGLKINAVAETSRATGSRWGGVQTYWLAEAASKTASKPEFRQMELSLKKLAALCYLTDELIQDTTALGSIVTQAFTEEMAWMIDNAIYNGSGAGQPLGIMNSPALITVAKEAGQAAATIVYENIIKMWARMTAASRANSAWFINQDIEPELFTMAHVVGTGGVPVYLPANGVAGSPFGTLMGRPVIPIEQAQTLGTTGDIALLDLSQYIMIDKGGIQQAESIHVRFTYDETVYRFVTRVDGQPAWNSALTPANGSNTVSPFVVLATRA